MIKILILFPLLFLIGCSKADKVALSTEKNITTAFFKMSDNPSLNSDVPGILLQDSVHFLLPQNINIHNLIPNIEHTGKKIEPGNRTPQDFTSGITYKITAEDGSIKNYFFRVTKISSDTGTLILGTWKLLKDSVTNNNWINPAGGYLIPGVYYGTPQDYFKFELNGMVSIRENNGTGTSTYSITAEKKLDIPIWTIQYGLGTIEKIDLSTLTIYYSATSSNGGSYSRKIYLYR